jgi:beta-lactamase regulating signal transducer with metallopeptidase domain
MNALGIAIVWCVLQVTLVAIMTGGLYFLVRKIWPAAGEAVALSSLLVVIGLSVMALSPWPHWSLPEAGPEAQQATLERSSPSRESTNVADAGTEGGTATGPSPLMLLWQAMRDELSQARPTSTTTRWRWPALVAAVVLAGIAVQLAWFVFGMLAVRSYRVRSRPVEDPGLLDLLDVLRAELGCVRPVELREADGLATAATIGWRRPLILLPSDWTQWNPAQRRAVLAHEIAHVRSSDFLAVLAGQVSVALHFYHPLVHWLLGRLRLEQELAADALAASVSGGQRSYLSTIAELALRQQDRPLLWPARSFLPTRNTFLRRIAMLRDSNLRFDRLSPAVRGGIIGGVVLCGLAVAGLRGPAATSQAVAEPPKTAASAAVEATEGIDLTYIPKDAKAVLVVRPAAIFRHPEFAGLAAVLNEPGSVTLEEYGVAVEDLVQMTMVIQKVPGPGESFDPKETGAVAVAQTVKPNDFSQCIERNVGASVVKKSYQGREYVIADGDKKRPAVYRPDDRTAILGMEPDLQKFIDGLGKGIPTVLGPESAWKELQSCEVAVGADGAIVRAIVTNGITHANPNAAPSLAPFAPLWEKADAALLGIDVTHSIEIQATALAAGEKEAGDIEQTLKAIRTLAQNALNSIQGPPEKEHEVLALRKGVGSFLDKLVLKREGSVVRAESSLSLEVVQPVTAAISAARNAAQGAQSSNNLKQIMVAMHKYVDKNRRFPPAVLYGPDGKTPYSWRVALLPYLGEMEKRLYEQYRFDEPWDSANNRKVLQQTTPAYQSPWEPPTSTNAAYFALVGPGTVFDARERLPMVGAGLGGGTGQMGGAAEVYSGKEGVLLQCVIDGTSNTIMLVEAKRDIPWTKPEDIPYDPDKPLPELGGYSPGFFRVALADASVRVIANSIEEKLLRAMITIAGGEPVAPQ